MHIQLRIFFNLESHEVRLAIRVLEKFFESAELNESVERSSVDVAVFVLFVVWLHVVEGVVAGGGAFEDPVPSVNQTFDGVACMMLRSDSSSKFVIMTTDWILFAIVLKLEIEKMATDWERDYGQKTILGRFVLWTRVVDQRLLSSLIILSLLQLSVFSCFVT